MKLLYLVGLLLAVSGTAFGQFLQKYRFGTGVFDFYGHIQWQELGPIPSECQKALAQMKAGDFATAAVEFREFRKRKPYEPSAMAGLSECMRRLKKLPALYNEVGSELQQATSKRQEPKPQLVVYYQYVISMIAYESEQGNIPKSFSTIDTKTPGGWMYKFSQSPVDWNDLSKPFWVMYLSRLVSTHLHLEARSTARRMLAAKSDFYQIRLLYAIELTTGVVAISTKDGKGWQDAPQSMRADPEEALKQAKQVLADAPNWLPAVYVTATCAMRLDKTLAKKLLTRYVKEADPSSPRTQYAKSQLAKLG